jgi:hypothetical protein
MVFNYKNRRFGRRRRNNRKPMRTGYNKARNQFESKTKYPPRFRQGWNSYKTTKAVSKVIRNMAELKLSPLASQNQTSPVNLGTTLCSSVNLITGNTTPSTYTGTWRDIDGFQWPQGDQITQRIGKYIYLKKTSLTMSIDMTSPSSTSAPVSFRVIVYKHRRSMDPVGVSPNPSTSLFIDVEGQTYGLLSAARNGNDYKLGMLNKRNFHILKDQQFILQATKDTATASSNGRYACSRQMRLQFGHSRKCTIGALGEPTDYDYRYGIIVLGIPQDIVAGEQANDFTVSLRGTTSAYDM